MLLIPLWADLGLASRPWVTYAVMLLCVMIFVAQWDRSEAVLSSADTFCELQAEIRDADSLRGTLLSKEEGCQWWLVALHDQPSREWFYDSFTEYLVDEFPHIERDDIRRAVAEIYGEFRAQAPRSLDALLVYDPKVPNPLRMVTSTLSHADFWHLFGNLLFFFAFAGSVEMALGSRRRYLAVLLGLAVLTSLAYSLTQFTSPERIPTLGLSGVVMGMIGLFAYLMPRARIRTFVWIILYVNIILVPAWILAAWFIGWDIWYAMNQEGFSAIDYSAHISGGLGGYLIGCLGFRERKEEIAPLVADEIEHRRATRADRLGIMDSSRLSTERTEIDAWHRNQRLALDRLLERVYWLATARESAKATALLIDELPALGDTLERQTEIMERMFQWPPNRTTLDFARLHIYRLLTIGERKRALEVCRRALEHSPHFVLADPFDAVALAEHAAECGRPDLALAMLRDYEVRYDNQGDPVRARYLSARLLWEHRLDVEAARRCLQPCLAHRDHRLHPDILRLARHLHAVSTPGPG